MMCELRGTTFHHESEWSELLWTVASQNRPDPRNIPAFLKTVPIFSLRVHPWLQRDQERRLGFIFRCFSALGPSQWDSPAGLESSLPLLL